MSEWIEVDKLEALVKRWEKIADDNARDKSIDSSVIVVIEQCITELQAVLSTASERTQYGMKQLNNQP